MKDIDKNSLNEALARNTLDDIPAPKSNAKEIIGLTKNSGRITGYQRRTPYRLCHIWNSESHQATARICTRDSLSPQAHRYKDSTLRL